VLSEFQLPFDLSSKDADLKDIEISYLYTRFGFVPTTMDHPNARVDQRYMLELD